MGVLAASGILILLAACGQKGPLYLPDRGTVITRPAGSAAPGTAPTQGQKTTTPPPESAPAPSDQAAPNQSSQGTPPPKPDNRKDDDDNTPSQPHRGDRNS